MSLVSSQPLEVEANADGIFIKDFFKAKIVRLDVIPTTNRYFIIFIISALSKKLSYVLTILNNLMKRQIDFFQQRGIEQPPS